MKLAIVGGGVAGLGAAWAARGAGAEVYLWTDRPGASALASGALDVAGWERDAPDVPVDPEVVAFAERLGAWAIGARTAHVSTPDGLLRPARGVDRDVLDLSSVAGGTVAVADVPLDGWSARSTARALAASAWAVRTGTRFEAVQVTSALDGSLARAPWADVAAAHSGDAGLARVAAALSESKSGADAWLVGPWLAARSGVAARLASMVGRPVGETTSPPGGAAGVRFEAARDALLASLGVHVRRVRVELLQRRGARWVPQATLGGEQTVDDVAFGTVIVAVGGLVSGGVVLDGAGAGRSTFRLGLDAPARVGVPGRALDVPLSPHGLDVSRWAPHELEQAGVLDRDSSEGADAGLLFAGDCVAARPRTALRAALDGIGAARRALGRATG